MARSTYPHYFAPAFAKGYGGRSKATQCAASNKKQPFSKGATTYFPNRMRGSIIGADVFHGLVRDGTGWFNVANVTLEKGCLRYLK